jgi:hypothetical protein
MSNGVISCLRYQKSRPDVNSPLLPKKVHQSLCSEYKLGEVRPNQNLHQI